MGTLNESGPLPGPMRARARELRAAMTVAENVLWQELRRTSLGVKFRRQHVLGPAIADFYCPSARLVVEVDGPIHDLRCDDDANRDLWMRQHGFRVLRVRNEEVLGDVRGVLERIRAELADALPSPLPRPLSQRERGGAEPEISGDFDG